MVDFCWAPRLVSSAREQCVPSTATCPPRRHGSASSAGAELSLGRVAHAITNFLCYIWPSGDRQGRLSSCAPSTTASPGLPLVPHGSILLDTPEATTGRWKIAGDSLNTPLSRLSASVATTSTSLASDHRASRHAPLVCGNRFEQPSWQHAAAQGGVTLAPSCSLQQLTSERSRRRRREPDGRIDRRSTTVDRDATGRLH